MNIINVMKAINIMERAGKVNMRRWQMTDLNNECNAADNEADLHQCGTAACLGGWIAVSPEFQEDGGSAGHRSGGPHFGVAYGSDAIAEWLSIPSYHSTALCALTSDGFYESSYSSQITKEMVLEKLYALRDYGEDSKQFWGDLHKEMHVPCISEVCDCNE